MKVQTMADLKTEMIKVARGEIAAPADAALPSIEFGCGRDGKKMDDVDTDWKPMKHSDFAVGGTFWCSDRQWRCTDIGTRVIVAIRIDSVEVGSNIPERCRTLNCPEAEAEGWFNGPPYAVSEVVFDEYDIEGCTLVPQTDSLATSKIDR